MNVTEAIGTACAAVGTTMGAGEVTTILEQTGTVSVPAVVVTVLNCVILAVNAGIAIYKKIRDLKNENKKNAEDGKEDSGKNGTDGRAEE